LSSQGTTTAKSSARRWSQAATEHADALDLERGVSTLEDDRRLAQVLGEQATEGGPLPSCSTSTARREESDQAGERAVGKAKDKLRKVFGK
jgi:hypothetical protein